MQLLDGKKYSSELALKYKEQTFGLNISLAIIQVGKNLTSDIYVRNKVRYCESVGIKVVVYYIEEGAREKLKTLIKRLNNDHNVTGIILQSPTIGIDFDEMIELIDSLKDVEGLTKDNIYRLYMNKEAIIPCTVKGIIKLFEYYNIDLTGKSITIIGRSNIVGKPLAIALENRNATVTLCHSKTKDLSIFTKNADIVISAVGIPKMITSDLLKDGFIGIDVGINKLNGKTYGDFDFDNVKEKASFITPVPGGIGPMTIAMIVDNLIMMKKRSNLDENSI